VLRRDAAEAPWRAQSSQRDDARHARRKEIDPTPQVRTFGPKLRFEPKPHTFLSAMADIYLLSCSQTKKALLQGRRGDTLVVM